MTIRPFRASLLAGLLTAIVVTSLTACSSATTASSTADASSSASIVGTQPLTGDAAKAALLTVVDASIAQSLKTGVTEQHTTGTKTFDLVYDSTAPVGKQVAGMDTTQKLAFYDTPQAVSLNKIKAYVDATGNALGTVAYTGTSFTIDNASYNVVLQVKDGLIIGSAITTAGSSTPQIVATTYSLTDIGKKILQVAITNTPAPTASATPAK